MGANALNSTILELLAQGPNGVYAKQQAEQAQTELAKQQARGVGAQADITQAGVPAAQQQAQMQQTGLAAEMKMWAQRHGIYKAAKSAGSVAPAAGQIQAPPYQPTGDEDQS